MKTHARRPKRGTLVGSDRTFCGKVIHDKMILTRAGQEAECRTCKTVKEWDDNQ